MRILKKIGIIYTGLLFSFSAELPGQSALNRTNNLTVHLFAADTSKTRTILKGNFIVLTLSTHLDGGYRYNIPVYNNKILKLEKFYTLAPPQNGQMGHPGKAIWKFLAITNGRSPIIVSESRPWDQKNSLLVWSDLVMVK